MHPPRRRWLLLAASAVLAACGGDEDEYWDEFVPRKATAADLASQSFLFRDFRNGAVFSPSWVSTPATLGFGVATRTGSVEQMPFTLAASGRTSSGTATLDGATLRLHFTATDPVHPFTLGEELEFEVTADVDDGRIHLRNLVTGESQASAPR